MHNISLKRDDHSSTDVDVTRSIRRLGSILITSFDLLLQGISNIKVSILWPITATRMSG